MKSQDNNVGDERKPLESIQGYRIGLFSFTGGEASFLVSDYQFNIPYFCECPGVLGVVLELILKLNEQAPKNRRKSSSA